MDNSLITLHGLYGNTIMISPDDIVRLEEGGVCTKVTLRNGDVFRTLEDIEEVRTMVCEDACPV